MLVEKEIQKRVDVLRRILDLRDLREEAAAQDLQERDASTPQGCVHE